MAADEYRQCFAAINLCVLAKLLLIPIYKANA